MDAIFIARTLARRGLLAPGRPDRMLAQLRTLYRWGYTLGGELLAAAARDPQRLAVIDDDRRVTYADLVGRARRLAVALTDAYGIGAGDRVGVMCRNRAGMVEIMAACSIVGADAVLVNTALSAPQLREVIADQRLRLLMHDREFTSFADVVGGVTLDEDAVEALIARAADRDMALSAAGRTIVLTSGTTGLPKGARRPTPNGIGPLCSIIDRIPLRVGGRMHVAAPLFHTWGYAALQLALATRGTVVLTRRFDVDATCDSIDRHRCDSLFAVPVMVARLMDAGRVPAHPPSVVATSGSAFPGGLVVPFMDRWGDCLYNLYGSTEASWVSIATPADLRRSPGTAGRPPYGTSVVILDAAGRPVPRGAVGHVYVANDMLFEGYTAGRGTSGRDIRDGHLGTGDLGHLDADGMLYVDGRVDDMVVSGGENVFPRPVEEVLAELPEVAEVAVVGVDDPEFGRRLAAYVVVRAGHRLDADAVRAHVRSRLARFSVPRDVHFLDALPRTATGKVVPGQLPR